MPITSKNALSLILVLLMATSCKHSKDSTGNNELLNLSTNNSNKSLLWKIEKEELSVPSYLFGTIHIIKSEDFFMGKNIEALIAQASKVVLEVDIQNLDAIALASAGLLPNSKTLDDYLSEDDYENLVQFMIDSVGVNRSTFLGAYSRMKPMFLEQLIVYRFLGENPQSYESEISDLAEINNVSVSGLETMSEQIGFLDKIPLKTQLKDLMESIYEYDKTKKSFAQMLDYYKDQDLAGLSKLIAEEFESDEKYQEILLDRRNKNWIPQLETLAKEGNAFIAVGAGHLGGEKGLINLLRKKGYQVSPISMD